MLSEAQKKLAIEMHKFAVNNKHASYNYGLFGISGSDKFKKCILNYLNGNNLRLRKRVINLRGTRPVIHDTPASSKTISELILNRQQINDEIYTRRLRIILDMISTTIYRNSLSMMDENQFNNSKRKIVDALLLGNE